MAKRDSGREPYDFVEDLLSWMRWEPDTPRWVRELPAVILLLIVLGMFIASL